MSDRLSPQDKLMALLKPYIEPLVKQRLKEEEKNMPLRERCGIALMLLWMNIAMKHEWIKRWIKHKDFRKNPPPFSFKRIIEPEIEYRDDSEMRKTLEVIIFFWMEVLALSAEDRTELSLSGLDDAMLPKKLPAFFKKESAVQLLDETCASLVVNAEDILNILRAIRQSLPAGHILPEAMIDYLKSAGVAIKQ